MSRNGYLPKQERRKILLLSDDLRMHSGIATMSRELIVQTCHRFNWVQIGAAMSHPESSTVVDISEDLSKTVGVEEASVFIYPTNGYGDPMLLRAVIEREQPDGIMFFTDPRYWIWLFGMEHELRRKLPMMYLNIWDDLPAPLYNKPYYESCDALFAISKQTLNINKMVLGEKVKDKVLKYTPHGIDHTLFYNITEENKEEYSRLQEFKKQLFKKQEYDFVILYNSRNIRRKSPSDLIAAYTEFCQAIGEEKAKKCLLLMHTDPVDENGTDLYAVRELLCSSEHFNVQFTEMKYSPLDMKYLYNCADVVCLPSSNEGWGLSLTEGLMCERMIIGTVTGGIQDQMRFENEKGEWIEFSPEFCSNHFGKYKQCGEWAVPVFPSNMSLVGSVLTPYIWDDRIDFRDLAKAIQVVYELPAEERNARGKKGREWLCSDEAKMTSQAMGKNLIEGIEETLSTWKPRVKFELVKAEKTDLKKLVHNLTY